MLSRNKNGFRFNNLNYLFIFFFSLRQKPTFFILCLLCENISAYLDQNVNCTIFCSEFTQPINENTFILSPVSCLLLLLPLIGHCLYMYIYSSHNARNNVGIHCCIVDFLVFNENEHIKELILKAVEGPNIEH